MVDGNDLGSCGDGAALRGLEEALCGQTAAKVNQDEKDILKSIWLGSMIFIVSLVFLLAILQGVGWLNYFLLAGRRHGH